LGDNELGRGRLTSDVLALAFAAIPPGVNTIHLSRNYLHLLGMAELAKVLKALPQTVTSINLRGNRLTNYCECAELVLALAALHPDITTLNFSDNGLNFTR